MRSWLNSHLKKTSRCVVGSTVATVVSTPHSKKVLGLTGPTGLSLSVWSVHVFPLSAWMLSGLHLSFLPHTKDCDSKLPINMNGCLSLCVSPVTGWWPVQAPVLWPGHRLSSYGCWDKLQLLHDPELDKQRRIDRLCCMYQNWYNLCCP